MILEIYYNYFALKILRILILQDKQDVTLSKILSRLLRHQAVKEGLHIGADGYIAVSDILNHKYLQGKYSVDDVKRVVNSNNKQRFSLRENANGILEICANQGHSLEVSCFFLLFTILFNSFTS